MHPHWPCLLMFVGQAYSGWDGFLGTRASFMLDVVFLAMIAVLPVLWWSIRLVRVHRDYRRHKLAQLALAGVLFIAVAAFEVDMRFFTNWRERAAASRFYQAEGWSLVSAALLVHLCFAVPTTLLWGVVVIRAWRRFPHPPQPAAHSPEHRRWGKLAALGMAGTAVTGWLYYVLAFVL